VTFPLQPAVFLDRDGTLMEEVHYCREASSVKVFSGVREGLLALRAAGFRTVLVTNQSGIGRGLITPQAYEAVHGRLLELLGPETLDAAYMSPETPEQPSLRRKPAPGMLLEAARDLHLDLQRSWMMGDKDIDIQCGVNAGVRSILVRTGHGASATGAGADYVAQDFAGAVRWLLEETPGVESKP